MRVGRDLVMLHLPPGLVRLAARPRRPGPRRRPGRPLRAWRPGRLPQRRARRSGHASAPTARRCCAASATTSPGRSSGVPAGRRRRYPSSRLIAPDRAEGGSLQVAAATAAGQPGPGLDDSVRHRAEHVQAVEPARAWSGCRRRGQSALSSRIALAPAGPLSCRWRCAARGQVGHAAPRSASTSSTARRGGGPLRGGHDRASRRRRPPAVGPLPAASTTAERPRGHGQPAPASSRWRRSAGRPSAAKCQRRTTSSPARGGRAHRPAPASAPGPGPLVAARARARAGPPRASGAVRRPAETPWPPPAWPGSGWIGGPGQRGHEGEGPVPGRAPPGRQRRRGPPPDRRETSASSGGGGSSALLAVGRAPCAGGGRSEPSSTFPGRPGWSGGRVRKVWRLPRLGQRRSAAR